MNDDAFEEDLAPLGDALLDLDKERTRLEKRAKRSAARSVEAQGGVVRLALTGGSTSWRDFLSYDVKGKPRGSAGNVLQVLERDEAFKDCVARDVFGGIYLWLKRPPFEIPGPFPREVRDGDIAYLTRWLEQTHEVFASPMTVGQMLTAVAEANEIDVLRTYLDGLKWDGRPRLDDWLVRLVGVTDTPYARAVGRRFLIAMAARGLKPGCKADTMLVLEGVQGKRKSTVLRALAGDAWYTDAVPLHVEDKDAVLALGGKWIIEFGELDRFRRTDRSALKDFMSRVADRIRPPFGRAPVTWQRRCVFTGTTNEQAYLDDATGSRRFWPVVVTGEIRVETLIKWRDQLLAEAVHALRAWETHAGDHRHPDFVRNQWWLSPEEEALQAEEVDGRQLVDPWESTLSEWAEGRDFLTVHEALRHIGLDVSKATKADQMRMGDLFRRLGFKERALKRLTTGREWRYTKAVSPPLSPPQKAGGDISPCKIRDVTTVTTVTTISPRIHARASDVFITGGDSSDGGDKAENAGVFVTTSDSEVVTNGRGGDSAPAISDLSDLWGAEWHDHR